MSEAPWLLPTQKVTGVVELSTNTLLMLVNRGSRYSTNWPVFGLSRAMRSFSIEPVHASPFLCNATSYVPVHGVGTSHFLMRSVIVSNILMRVPRDCPNRTRA